MGRLTDLRDRARRAADRLFRPPPAAPGMCDRCRDTPIGEQGRRVGIALCDDCLNIAAW